MKTSEFIKRLEDMGYEIRYSEYLNDKIIFIDKGDVYGIASAGLDRRFEMEVTKPDMVTDYLFHLIAEYARTPINDRDEPKKYRLKHKFFNRNRKEFEHNENDNENYLGLDAYGYYLTGDIYAKQDDIQTQFTDDEIDSMPFKITDDQWEREEV